MARTDGGLKPFPGKAGDSPSLNRVGFFHFGCADKQKGDPVGCLEAELQRSAQIENSLIVLPEAFNARGGYYGIPVDLDENAMSRLQRLSVLYHVLFVAGLIEGIGGYNAAFLINGNASPSRLSRKRCGGKPELYIPSISDEDKPELLLDAVVAARICQDATEDGAAPGRIVDKAAQIADSRHVLFCIPAYMGTYESRGVAASWVTHFGTVVLANGCPSKPSVIIHNGRELIPEDSNRNEIKFCDLTAGLSWASRE